ncbi:MAG: hypothetical protein ABR511_08820 [Acidimicrobiales bacterium]
MIVRTRRDRGFRVICGGLRGTPGPATETVLTEDARTASIRRWRERARDEREAS